MNRGLYKSILERPGYKESKKEWIVELSRSDVYWYDLLINSHELFDTKKLITDALKKLKHAVETSLEKRFVYFIFSRKKVRFDITKKIVYCEVTGQFNLSLLIGRDREELIVVGSFYDLKTKKGLELDVELSERFITITDITGDKSTFPIHEFLQEFGINIGCFSTVHYVGYTKNPHTRPTNGAHSGLNEVLYKVSNEDNDILISFNLFKVTVTADIQPDGLKLYVPNAMTDEIHADLEGLIIEKCFILYFDSNNQTKNKNKERKELKNNLTQLSTQNNIKTILLHYELEKSNEYWKLGSSSIKSCHSHTFNVQLENGVLQLSNTCLSSVIT